MASSETTYSLVQPVIGISGLEHFIMLTEGDRSVLFIYSYS